MWKLSATLIVLCIACGNPDNLILGGIAGGPTTPNVIFDNIGSSIHGVATMRDAEGNPVGDPLSIIIMSDVSSLCDRLRNKPDYFRNAPEAYEALVLAVRLGYLGTFIVGRQSDPGTAAEIIAASGPQVTTPFHAINQSYIALTEWSDGNGNAMGSFYLLMDDPYGTGVAHPITGQFKTDFCPTLEGVLLP